MIIDGTNLILGRVATVAAKRALEGEKVVILNCENMIITGSRKDVIEKFKSRQDKGHPMHGPYFPKMPDRIVRRAVRGMLTHKKERGRNAYQRVKCYIGLPDQFKSEKSETIKHADASKLKTLKYLRVGDLSKYYGKEF